MEIKILGSGCKKCTKLMENVQEAVDTMVMDATISKVTDIKDIIGYGVMSTPALVVDEKVVSTGKLLSPKAVIKLLK